MPLVTVVVPTLAADDALLACLDSLNRQLFRDFETVVVDNSTRHAVSLMALPVAARILAPPRNLGFGAAINLAARDSAAEFIATLNDDAVASPEWLAQLVETAQQHPEAGMFASQVRLAPAVLDSAGMLLAADGSSKQRGHLRQPSEFDHPGEALFPSGSAALYRRELFSVLGGFNPDYFLYCEDTDLGLRALWAGWRCRYVPRAVVEHRYSHSVGRASPLKAYLVERNRLFTVVRNFPCSMLWRAPFAALLRYGWHLHAALTGMGAAGLYRAQGGSSLRLAWFVLKAHAALVANLPRLLRQRVAIRRHARIPPARFRAFTQAHRISVREVAAL